MDTSWWLALAAVVVLALVATVVDGWGRGRGRSRGAGRAARRPASGVPVRPRAAEIWWAVADEAERPFLVLSVRGDAVRVATITTRFHDERAGVIPLPPGTVGDVQGRASFLEPDGVRELWAGDFRRRAGVVDPALWDQVRYLGGG
ncbi:type II toxin-antitoxin system PemK/MazF family toxin [Streptomyces sp. AN091965]|uniref:type II toxin-antitoxin system PemK/MazF family toxin n=1 Tax=Streptomyces sp. AN091965 TaxID=2927803 RepID=UPI001F613111|nr:type II toxin-antitoxin system PemK/MazF family toxin [Streptomyces sp. AN091965]MCI3930960.1 type II toxin-antitoxin system PemK/MazF family toxin [Streptomyces sp. AN091965]